MLVDLPARLDAAYKKCAMFPEIRRNEDGTFLVKGPAFIGFLELRHLMTEVRMALWELQQLTKSKP